MIATVTNSTISNNTAEKNSGGIHVSQTSGTTLLTVINSTITENSATGTAGGAGRGGGIRISAGEVILHNTILAGNTSTSSTYEDSWGNVGGTSADPSSNNIIGVWNSGIGINDGVNENQVGTSSVPLDPRLAPLNRYGGRTPTHALYEDSPAIDSGNDSKAVDAAGNPLLVDQRGFTRVLDVVGIHNEGMNVVDIGAFEDPCVEPVVNSLTDVDDNDVTTLRNAINQAISLSPGMANVTFETSLFADGLMKEIELFDQITIVNPVTIKGPGADLLSIDAKQNNRVFSIDPDITVEMRDLTITGGESTIGAGILAQGDLTLKRVNVAGNAATSLGGGIYVLAPPYQQRTVNITDSTIDDNSAKHGGGLYFDGPDATSDIDITGTTFSNNRADVWTYSRGGGLYVDAYEGSLDLDIENSTFSQNLASLNGGGVYLGVYYTGNDSAVFTNATIADNQITGSGQGGGIYVDAGANTVKLNNTIVALNTKNGTADPDDVSGSFATSSSYNLIGVTDGSTGLNAGTSIWGDLASPQAPGLAPLGDYGGPTQTHALLSGSPAIDKGLDSLASSSDADQRGYSRIVNTTVNTVDIGAFEANLIVTTSIDEKDGSNGQLSLREALARPTSAGIHRIEFAPSLLGATIELNNLYSHLLITKDVEIVGLGVDNLTIDAKHNRRVFYIPDGTVSSTPDADFVTITDLTITGGYSPDDGGGIYNNTAALTLKNVNVSGNIAPDRGGGIFNSSQTLTLIDVVVGGESNSEGNQAKRGGGIYNNVGTTHILRGAVQGNFAHFGVGDGGVRWPILDGRVTL